VSEQMSVRKYYDEVEAIYGLARGALQQRGGHRQALDEVTSRLRRLWFDMRKDIEETERLNKGEGSL
jgi:hypothetical protein